MASTKKHGHAVEQSVLLFHDFGESAVATIFQIKAATPRGTAETSCIFPLLLVFGDGAIIKPKLLPEGNMSVGVKSKHILSIYNRRH